MTLAAKLAPPVRLSGSLSRERLESRVEDALQRRLTCVVAEAGFGKSTLLAEWARGTRTAWFTVDPDDAHPATLGRGLAQALCRLDPALAPGLAIVLEGRRGPEADPSSSAEAVAAVISEVLDPSLREPILLVIDDLHVVSSSPVATELVESLVRQAPPDLHIVIGSRQEPPFPVERLRGQGQLLEISGAALCFTHDELALLMSQILGEHAPEIVDELEAVTGGWPAAVRLALEALRDEPAARRGATIAAIPMRQGGLFDYLAQEVIDKQAQPIRQLMARMALFDRLSPGLVAGAGLADAETVSALARRGMFVQVGGDGSLALHGLVRRFVEERMPLPPRSRRELLRRAARWLVANGDPESALAALRRAESAEELIALLRARGEGLVASGAVRSVIAAIDALPPGPHPVWLDLLEGEACMIAGSAERALACFERAAGDSERLPPGQAWRMGLLRYLRGEIVEAMAAFARGITDEGDPADITQLLAWTATGHWLQGDLVRSRELVARGLELARANDDDHGLAAVHTVLAMLASVDGDGTAMEEHSATALEAAERSGDSLQVIRILNNRASHRGDEGRFPEALDDLDRAIRRADLTGYAFFRALALSNRASILATTGQLDTALAAYDMSQRIYRQMGSRSVRYPLIGIADIHRARGDLALARAGYEEALGYAEQAGDVQALTPALAGLARVMVPEDLDRARDLAQRAMATGTRPSHVGAVVSAGWVALARGDDVGAAGYAADALAEARRRQDLGGLGEALELSGATAATPDSRTSRLHEALEIWSRVGDPLAESRVALALGRLSGGASGRVAAERAATRLSGLGVRLPAASVAGGLLNGLPALDASPVAIQTLGGFGVLRDGTPVPPGEWQSRKARDLLKVLAARRGRQVARETLMEILWPEEEPSRLPNRLSVALATARAILDPGRRHAPDRFIASEADAIWLDESAVSVDAERFVTDADAGLSSLREGAEDEAYATLSRAEAAYTGDFLEEDTFADWAVPFREEARAVYIAVARALASSAAGRGDFDASIRYTLRVLERDQFDEEAHLRLVTTLIRAGRHGEARRHYRAYALRMSEIEVEAAPYPAIAHD